MPAVVLSAKVGPALTKARGLAMSGKSFQGLDLI